MNTRFVPKIPFKLTRLKRSRKKQAYKCGVSERKNLCNGSNAISPAKVCRCKQHYGCSVCNFAGRSGGYGAVGSKRRFARGDALLFKLNISGDAHQASYVARFFVGVDLQKGAFVGWRCDFNGNDFSRCMPVFGGCDGSLVRLNGCSVLHRAKIKLANWRVPAYGDQFRGQQPVFQ